MANASDLYIMQGASGGADGKRGIVPKPVAGDNVKVLKGDATFGSIVEANITAGTLTTASTATGSKTGADTKFVTGTAGTNNNLVSWNSDGDAVDAGISITQARAGQLVKVTEATLGSDSTVTATSATAIGLQVSYTPVTSSNVRYIQGLIDWNVFDNVYGTTDNKAEAQIFLEYSTDNSIWTTLQTYTRTTQVSDGKKLVGMSQDTIPSDISTTSTTLANTGLQVDYTAVNGSNDRYIEFNLPFLVQRSGTNTTGRFELQFSADGSSWSVLDTLLVRTQVTGGSFVLLQTDLHGSVLHQTADDTPQYRIQYKCEIGTSSETLNLYADGAYLRVSEYATDIIDHSRTPLTFNYKHSDTTTTPYYRITTLVTTGDVSKTYAGSTLRVMEYSDV